jgi:hypothetical protein
MTGYRDDRSNHNWRNHNFWPDGLKEMIGVGGSGGGASVWGGSRTTLMGGQRRNIAGASEWGGSRSTLRGGLNGHIEVRNACRRLNMRCTCSKGVLTCRAETRVLDCKCVRIRKHTFWKSTGQREDIGGRC